MKSTKPKHFVIDLIIYPMDIVISIGETEETIIKNFPGFTAEHIKLEESDKARTYLENDRILIRFRGIPNTPEERGDEAHEVFHAVCYAMQYIGVSFTAKGAEAYSYLIDYVTTELEKNIIKK